MPYTPSLPLPLPLPSHYLYLYLYHGREGECPVLIRVLETGLAKILEMGLQIRLRVPNGACQKFDSGVKILTDAYSLIISMLYANF